MNDDAIVELFCTDRGQHKRTWLVTLAWFPPDERGPHAKKMIRERLLHDWGPGIGLPEITDQDAIQQADLTADRILATSWTAHTATSEQKHDSWFPVKRSAEPGEWSSTVSNVLICARCSRTPRHSSERWDQLVEGLRRAGVDEFDVSYLD